jgi:hypothetical protein
MDVNQGVIRILQNFWDIAPCCPYVKRRFGGKYHLHLHGRKSLEQETSVKRRARIIFDPENGRTETSVHIRTTRRYIPKDDKIHKYRGENVKCNKV